VATRDDTAAGRLRDRVATPKDRRATGLGHASGEDAAGTNAAARS